MITPEIIVGCLKNEAWAQRKLYTSLAPRMKGLCLRYTKNSFEAEDILQDGFVKIFTKMKSYDSSGSFEAWARRIFVNTAIDHYKKKQKLYLRHVDYEEAGDSACAAPEPDFANLAAADLMKLIANLPDGFRLVFNLFAIEGFSHKEIAEMLGITEGTSKSQLSRAREHLQNSLKEMNIAYEGKYAPIR